MSKKICGWNPYITVIENGNKVIIANRWDGRWIKISKECFNIILEIVKNNPKEIIWDEISGEKEDIDYIKKLINILTTMDVFTEKDYCVESVYLSLTHKCNLHCIHCSVDADINQQNVLSLQDIKDIIKKLQVSKVQTLIFTGGEPLIRDDFLEILKYARSIFSGKIVMMTNGTLINEANIKTLVENLDAIDMSIDGVNEATCSIIRGKGVFKKVMQSIELLHKNSFRKISLSMVSSIENNKVVNEFYCLNKKLGTKPVIRVFCERGRGKTSKSKFIENSAKLEKQIDKKEYKEKKEELYGKITACSCGAGHKILHINYDGKIYPCSLLIDKTKYLLGDIREVDDINLLNQYGGVGIKNIKKIQPEMYLKCKECCVNIFCWNCLEQIDRIGDTAEFEARCESIKEYLEDVMWN